MKVVYVKLHNNYEFESGKEYEVKHYKKPTFLSRRLLEGLISYFSL